MYKEIIIDKWYIEVNWINIPVNQYNKWAIEMLQLISKWEGWEDSETNYLELFFKD